MIFNQGYSYRTKQLARERIEKLKQQNQQEIIIRKQKIKELSKQTNELRKKIKDKSQTLQEEEDERRATILENRKLKQRIATEKFQRIQDKRAKRKGSASKHALKNGTYHVNGHVIEIKDGVRVSSMKQDDTNKNLGETPPFYNNTSYAPNAYLDNHLNQLITSDLTYARKVDSVNGAKLDKSSQDDINLVTDGKPLISDVLNDLRYEPDLVQRKIKDTADAYEDVDSDCDRCSVDSLEEDTKQEQRMLKSSLKISRDGLNESATRKVTFSDSIEFNDGNIAKLEIKPIERIPLYQRIENRNKEAAKAAANNDSKPITNGISTPITNSISKPTKPTNNTAEEVLDQLRKETLATKVPEISYPESVTAALEQLSQSKKIEKEINKDNYVANELSYPEYTQEDSFKHDETLYELQKKRTSSFMRNEFDSTEASNVKEIVDSTIGEKRSQTNGHNVLANGMSNGNCSTGYEVVKENRNASHSIPVSSIAAIHTTSFPISKQSTNVYGDSGHLYHVTSTSVSNKDDKTESSCSSVSLTTPSVSHTNVSSTNIHQTPQRKTENNDEETSAVLYVPQYPYFPSKEQRYATNGAYDGRLPMNYYESQYTEDYRDSSTVNIDYNTTSSSRVNIDTNGYHSAYSSPGSPIISSNQNHVERGNTSDSCTRELSLSYINITACDISARPSNAHHSKHDDIYKEVERTLAGISFGNAQNKKVNDKPNYSNDSNNQVATKEISDSFSKNAESSDACNGQSTNALSNESKISNAIKNGTAIPVRVHTNGTNDGSPARRGRVIVSADKKRRQVGNMLPRPPDKPKTNTNMEKNPKVIVATKREVPDDEKSSSNINKKVVENNDHGRTENRYINGGHVTTNGKIINGRVSPAGTNGKVINGRVSPQRTPVRTNSDYYSDHSVSRTSFNTYDNRTDFNNNIQKYSSPASNTLPKSYVRVSPNMLPWNKPQSKNFPPGQIPLDKTPTDDEINKLWTNVRECIYTEQTEHAYSDSNYVIDNRYRKQYRRTLSGSSINRRVDDRPAPRIYTNYTPNHGMNRRYGSHDSLNRHYSNSSDSFSPVFNKPALLPQRATKVIRNSNSSSENKYTVFKGNDNLSNGHRYQLDAHHGKNGDVTSSMASFLVLEELCKKQSLTPRQAEAVFQASNTIQKKIDREKGGMSALSMEERCVMESLERLNEKLKEKGFRGGDAPRIVSSKPPLPEQRRRMYPAQ